MPQRLKTKAENYQEQEETTSHARKYITAIHLMECIMLLSLLWRHSLRQFWFLFELHRVLECQSQTYALYRKGAYIGT